MKNLEKMNVDKGYKVKGDHKRNRIEKKPERKNFGNKSVLYGREERKSKDKMKKLPANRVNKVKSIFYPFL